MTADLRPWSLTCRWWREAFDTACYLTTRTHARYRVQRAGDVWRVTRL